MNNLPDDIVLYMSDNFLNKNNHRLLNTCGFYPDYEKQQKDKIIEVSAYRIMLFYLIKKLAILNLFLLFFLLRLIYLFNDFFIILYTLFIYYSAVKGRSLYYN